MRLSPDQLNRAAGVLLGAAVGDALGVPYEFQPALPASVTPEMRGGGLGPYRPGEYSDDTQMAVMIGRVLADGGDVREAGALDRVAQNFLWWQDEGASDIGAQTSAVLSRTRDQLRSGSPAEVMTRVAEELHQRTGRSAGNGSLMRTAPVALRYLDDAGACADAARRVSALTHYDPQAGDACTLWCDAVRRAVLGEGHDLDGGLHLVPQERRALWAARVAEARDKRPAEFPNNGWVVAAFQAAASAALSARTAASDEERFTHGVHAAVRAGNDTDTVAAIAGALLGAACGAGAIPGEYTALVNGWPDMTGRELEAMALQIAARAGEPA